MTRTRKVKAKVKVRKGKIKEKTEKAKIKAHRRRPGKEIVDVPEGAHRRARLKVIPATILLENHPRLEELHPLGSYPNHLAEPIWQANVRGVPVAIIGILPSVASTRQGHATKAMIVLSSTQNPERTQPATARKLKEPTEGVT